MQAIRWSLRPSAPPLAMLGLRQSRGLCLVPVCRWVYASLATWCTAPISRTLLAVEALRLVKKDHPGARASRPHKAWHDGRAPRKGGFGAPCKGVALDGRLFAGIGCGRDARAPGWMTNQGRRSMQAIRWSLRPSAPRLAMLGLRQSRGLCLVPVSRGSMLHWRLGALHRFLGPFSRWRHYGS